MIELFLKRTKGSITVMVTLILVPTIFFTGFLVDLARVKLYSNQALMAADNYGEAVISEYDNLLKELYGLFAVTQNKEGKEALKALQGYMASSFDPNQNAISQKYFQEAQKRWGWNTNYDGFMPYRQAQLEFSYTPADGANLGNEKVMTTQIGDFMKFRIAQQLLDDGEIVMDALEQVEGSEDDAEVMDAKKKVDDQAGVVLEKARDYYVTLDKIQKYPAYLTAINQTYAASQSTFQDIAESDSYQIYHDYITHESEIAEARHKKDNLEEGESLSSREEELIEMGDKYDEDSEARRGKLQEKFDTAVEAYKSAAVSEPVSFDNYEELVHELKERAEAVKKEIGTLQTLKGELDNTLSESEIDPVVQKNIDDSLNRIDMLFDKNGVYSANNYVNLASDIDKENLIYVNRNSEYRDAHHNNHMTLEDIEEDYLECRGVTAYGAPLSEGLYFDFRNVPEYRTLYDESLVKCFSGEGDSKKYEDMKDSADNKLKEKETQLSGDESTSARDIPEAFGFEEGEDGGNFVLSNLIGEMASFFSLNSFQEAGNQLLLKFYTVSYDFGMFSSRITNVKNSSEEDGAEETEAVSLTGIKMGPEVNYLYGAELEYLLGGNNSSVKNLNLSRNRILAFRAVINMRATYKIGAINGPIKGVQDACSAFNPVLGIAVGAALRAAVTGIETYKDWEELKKGNAVAVFKEEVSDLTAYDEIKTLIGEGSGSDGAVEKKKIKLDYEQYLMIMAVFLTKSEQIVRRTGNLITLNMNTVVQKKGAGGTLEELTWHLSDAVTAVDATCSIHLDFVVMPDGFAEQMASADQYQELQNFEKNAYKFTVTRGY